MQSSRNSEPQGKSEPFKSWQKFPKSNSILQKAKEHEYYLTWILVGLLQRNTHA